MPAAGRSTPRIPGSFGPRVGLLIARLLPMAMAAAAWGVRVQLDTLERLRGPRRGLVVVAGLQALSAALRESRSDSEIESAWSRAAAAAAAGRQPPGRFERSVK
jgi:hypothetical protein